MKFLFILFFLTCSASDCAKDDVGALWGKLRKFVIGDPYRVAVKEIIRREKKVPFIEFKNDIVKGLKEFESFGQLYGQVNTDFNRVSFSITVQDKDSEAELIMVPESINDLLAILEGQYPKNKLGIRNLLALTSQTFDAEFLEMIYGVVGEQGLQIGGVRNCRVNVLIIAEGEKIIFQVSSKMQLLDEGEDLVRGVFVANRNCSYNTSSREFDDVHYSFVKAIE